jgi:hypothetical protein
MNGDSKSSTVLDAATGKVVGRIDLGGEPEFPVTDGQRHIYANIASTSEIIELDSHTLKITHRWPLAPGEHPGDLAIDTEHRFLFSGCRSKLMAVVNAGADRAGRGCHAVRSRDAIRFRFKRRCNTHHDSQGFARQTLRSRGWALCRMLSCSACGERSAQPGKESQGPSHCCCRLSF